MSVDDGLGVPASLGAFVIMGARCPKTMRIDDPGDKCAVYPVSAAKVKEVLSVPEG